MSLLDQTPRDAKAEIRSLKRKRILDVAAQRFFEKGYHGTSMDDLCTILGVSKPFIYYHFPKKEDILLALYDASISAALATVEAAKASVSNPIGQIRRFAHDYTLLVVTEQQRVALISREKGLLDPERMRGINVGKRAFLDRLVEILLAGRQAGAFDFDDASLTAHAITGAITWTLNWYTAGGRLRPEQIATSMEGTVLRMVGANPQHGPYA